MPTSPRIASRYLNGKRWAFLIAAALTVIAVIVLLTVPQYAAPGGSAGHGQLVTALQANGPRFLIALAIPVVLVAIPLPVRGPAWKTVCVVCAVLYAAYTAVTFVSVGIYLFPAAVVQIFAVWNHKWRHLA